MPTGNGLLSRSSLEVIATQKKVADVMLEDNTMNQFG